MKRIITCLIIFLFLSSSLYSQTSDEQDNQLSKTRKNSIYVACDFLFTMSINYERLFPLNERYDLGIRAGLGRDGGNKDNVAIVEGIFLYGKHKHHLELGIGYQHPNLFEHSDGDKPMVAFMGGYRYQAPKGFLLKVYAEFLPDFFPDEDSWGSFPFIGFALGYSF